MTRQTFLLALPEALLAEPLACDRHSASSWKRVRGTDAGKSHARCLKV